MAKRAQLKKHIRTLTEIGDIMEAMKNLALIEINKLAKSLSSQEQSRRTLQDVGRDFLHGYPEFYTQLSASNPFIDILIGSERGFCTNFNDKLINHLDKILSDPPEPQTKLILIGHKLAMKLSNDERVIHVIEGPSTVEDIPAVIANLLIALEQASKTFDHGLNPNCWRILYNQLQNTDATITTLQPFFELASESSPTPFLNKPLLNVSPELFLFEYIHHYMFSLLHSIFYESFHAENTQRSRHLENAIDRLGKKNNNP